MITTEKILEERRSGPLIQISDDTFDEECFQQVLSAWVWKRETNNLFIKLAVSQNVLVRPHNITSILNNFIHLIKQVCQERCTQKISIKSIKITKSHQFYTKGRKNCLDWKRRSKLTFSNKQDMFKTIKFKTKFTSRCIS